MNGDIHLGTFGMRFASSDLHDESRGAGDVVLLKKNLSALQS